MIVNKKAQDLVAGAFVWKTVALVQQ